MMLESNIHEGNQKIKGDLKEMAYGVSITDAVHFMGNHRKPSEISP
jgi:phospho-2-dehydro-3-deoxyheptonate aldolase